MPCSSRVTIRKHSLCQQHNCKGCNTLFPPGETQVLGGGCLDVDAVTCSTCKSALIRAHMACTITAPAFGDWATMVMSALATRELPRAKLASPPFCATAPGCRCRCRPDRQAESVARYHRDRPHPAGHRTTHAAPRHRRSAPPDCAQKGIVTPPSTSVPPSWKACTSKTLPDPHDQCPCLQIKGRQFQIRGYGYFYIVALPLHHARADNRPAPWRWPRRLPAVALSMARLQGRSQPADDGTSAAYRHATGLRVQPWSVIRGHYRIHLLHGIGNRHPQQPAVSPSCQQRFEIRLLDICLAHTGSRGVMHQHPVILISLAGQLLQTIQYRMTTFRPACCDLTTCRDRNNDGSQIAGQ